MKNFLLSNYIIMLTNNKGAQDNINDKFDALYKCFMVSLGVSNE